MAVDLGESVTYALATYQIMAAGGDGYPDVSERATTREIMDVVLADSVAAAGTVSPELQGRIVCSGEGCPVATGL